MPDQPTNPPVRRRRSDRYNQTDAPAGALPARNLPEAPAKAPPAPAGAWEVPERRAEDAPRIQPHPPARTQRKALGRPGRVPWPLPAAAGVLLLLAIAFFIAQQHSLNSLLAQRQAEVDAFNKRVQGYSTQYRTWVEQYAAQNDVHPAFIAAIIRHESSYNPYAVSSAGARGLMQIMPDAYETIHRWLQDEATFDDLFDPETNIRYGCRYIAQLSRTFYGDPVLIACAYHAGPNNVKLWMMKYSADGKSLALKDIPMENTRTYAERVLDSYAIYYQYYYPDHMV